MWQFRDDDLTGVHTRAFVSDHLAQMQAQSPAESVHALDVDALRAPDIRFVTAWRDDQVCGMGAFRRMEDHAAEVKSMRVAEAVRGLGLGRLLLRHLIDRARSEGISVLWLETGSSADFRSARGLYLSEGFVPCDPFGSYREDPESVFFRRDI
ncbi:GNAT family N-acetyltransferase [Microbacterium abyssi]|uniref:GNAT family N-acetyltransferase n=1 Tax=Microbacterium abyssi TaxID=2782166 RepID=UPI0018886D9A|nr:GNAT family N-acetyltransferase [Microbacterium sp. A18JL241]